MAAQHARRDRPRNGRDTRFKPKNPGRPKGIVSRRAQAGQEAARALEVQAWDVVERLLSSPSWRARHEAAKTTLAYALGLPRQAVDVAGFGDLAAELAVALKTAREQRAALNGPAASLPLAPPGDRMPVRAELLAAEVASPEGISLAGGNPQLSEPRNEPERTPS